MPTFKPDEFIVEEILEDGTVLERGMEFDRGKPEDEALERDYFTHFVLEKTNWTTSQALAAIAKRCRASAKRFDSAGSKDRNAVTTQLASAFAIDPGVLLTTRVKDVKINGAWKARKKVKLGELAGNRFTITLNKDNVGSEPDADKINETVQSAAFLFPNYFGRQRFGSLRQNTHTVGALLCQGKTEEAVMSYLCDCGSNEREDSVAARNKLRESRDFNRALTEFPSRLYFEKKMLAWLARHPNDFAGAFRTLDRHTQLLFVHAAQSLAFNIGLKQRLDKGTINDAEWWCPTNALGFPDETTPQQGKIEGGFPMLPVPGSDSPTDEAADGALAKMGLTRESFSIKAFPELSSKGTLRSGLAPLKDFSATQDGSNTVLRFSLPSGCYATVALDFLLGGAPFLG